MNSPTVTAPGLAGVVVADTRLSLVDGDRGRLIVCGRPIGELAGRVPFEAACELLWAGDLPADVAAVARRMAEARAHAFDRLPDVRRAAERGPMGGLQALLAQMAPADDDPEAPRSITAATAVAVAALARVTAGSEPLAPDPSLGHAADFARTLTGVEPTAAAAHALDTYLVAVCEHGMNASTFAARVVASTRSDMGSAVVAAVGALKGPLHGGAPGPVLDMLDAVGSVDGVEPWLRAELAAGRRIMGMGHRVYRVRDPCVAVLESVVEAMGDGSGRLEVAREVERTAAALLRERHPDRSLCANVEFMTALLLEAVGIPRERFSSTFAAARVAGWCAHVLEQRADPMLRPRARYVGPMPRDA